jgi:hypothetical protein
MALRAAPAEGPIQELTIMDDEQAGQDEMDDEQLAAQSTLGQPDADEPTTAAADDDSDAPVRLVENGHLPAAAGDIRAENVTLTQGGARDIEATTVSISQGGAAQVRAEELSLSQSGVALARTGNMTVGEGGSAFAVLADKATIEEGGNVFLLVAGEVSGDAQPLLDWRAALALGAGLAVAWSLIRRILR